MYHMPVQQEAFMERPLLPQQPLPFFDLACLVLIRGSVSWGICLFLLQMPHFFDGARAPHSPPLGAQAQGQRALRPPPSTSSTLPSPSMLLRVYPYFLYA
eukprot:GGOE01028843.1.p3 GENE.GGOE01028843.1~~GGOE01028843.1.p3  ORF type:complete len:100 (+),score=3.68 GGOE01028843.1:568-867(+)